MQTTLQDAPAMTHTAWQNARNRASDGGIPFHKPWEDFNQFIEDVGLCPHGDHSYLVRRSEHIGFVPGNCFWNGISKFTRSFAECPVAVAYSKTGMFDESVAVALAGIDAEPAMVTAAFRALEAETKGKTARFRREAIGALVVSLEFDYGVVPFGEPSRWEIQSACAAIRAEHYEKSLDSPGSNQDDESNEILTWDLDEEEKSQPMCVGRRARRKTEQCRPRFNVQHGKVGCENV